jgi:hypothetical protein
MKFFNATLLALTFFSMSVKAEITLSWDQTIKLLNASKYVFVSCEVKNSDDTITSLEVAAKYGTFNDKIQLNVFDIKNATVLIRSKVEGQMTYLSSRAVLKSSSSVTANQSTDKILSSKINIGLGKASSLTLNLTKSEATLKYTKGASVKFKQCKVTNFDLEHNIY